MRPRNFAIARGGSRAIHLVSMALALSCVISTLHAQDAVSRPTVNLSLIITDKANKSVNSVANSDVRVFEGKVEQAVQSIAADTGPIDYGLLIDSSGSMKSQMRSVLGAASLIIINRRPEDRISIMRFISSDKIEKVEDFTTDKDKLLESLTLIDNQGGQSAVVDAIYVGAQHLAENKTNPKRRQALVIITDGEDRNSYYKSDHLIKYLHEHGVQVFALGLVSDLNDKDSASVRASVRDRAENLLKKITAESGGRVFFPITETELMDSTKQIILDLRAQFRITYQSSQDSSKKGFRKVEVKLISPTDEKRTAIAPRGYYVGSQQER